MQSTQQRPGNSGPNKTPGNRPAAPKSKAGKANGSSFWLQTLVVTGSLAATGIGAGMISHLEALKSDLSSNDSPSLAAVPVELAPIPTLMVPPTAVVQPTAPAVALGLPTATPTEAAVAEQSAPVIPTDTAQPTATVQPTATATPQPTATAVIRQQSSSFFTPSVRRRSRSSR